MSEQKDIMPVITAQQVSDWVMCHPNLTTHYSDDPKLAQQSADLAIYNKKVAELEAEIASLRAELAKEADWLEDWLSPDTTSETHDIYRHIAALLATAAALNAERK